MKSIALRKDITPNVKILLHPSLADILITNLCSNAIRHNINKGHIFVSVKPGQLVISNSGQPPEVPPALAFERFRRTSQHDDSVGLGLAIVKQICDVSGASIKYEFDNGDHTVTLTFRAA